MSKDIRRKSTQLDLTAFVLRLTKSRALNLTSNYLGQQWNNLTENDIDLRVLSGGYSNSLYLCEIKEPSKYVENGCNNNGGGDDGCDQNMEVPNSILIRIYGHVCETDPYRTLTETGEVILFSRLSQAGLGPKLYGVFENGRLEEFIPSHTMSDNDLMNPTIREHFARKLARFHNLGTKLPLGKHPVDQFGVIQKKIEQFIDFKEDFLENSKVINSPDGASKLASFDFLGELDWLRVHQPKIKSPLVFSTNDMNRLNCLIRDKADKFGEIVTLIDYEFSSTNYRGSDLGGHFGYWIMDFNQANFRSSLQMPSEEIRREYAQIYLDETRKVTTRKLNEEFDTVDHILFEAEFYGLNVMLLFLAWILEPEMNCIEHENGAQFLSLGMHMMNNYIERKENFLKKYKDEIC